MGTVRVSGVKRSEGLTAAAFTPLLAGSDMALYMNDTRHVSLMDEAWHPIHAIKVGEGVSGRVRVSFLVWNSAYNDFETTFGRVRVGNIIYPQMAANNYPCNYQQDVDVQPGDIVYIDVYCDGYGSTSLVEYIRLGVAQPVNVFERVYI